MALQKSSNAYSTCDLIKINLPLIKHVRLVKHDGATEGHNSRAQQKGATEGRNRRAQQKGAMRVH